MPRARQSWVPGPGRQGCEQLLCSCLPAAPGQLSQESQPTYPGFWGATNPLCCLGSQTFPPEKPQLQLATLRCSGFSSKCFQALKWTLIAASCHAAGGFSTLLSAGKELCMFRPVLLWGRTYSNFSSHSQRLISPPPAQAEPS